MPNCPVRYALPFPWCVAAGTGYFADSRYTSCLLHDAALQLSPVPMGQAPSVSYPTSLAPGHRHSRIAAGFRYAPELPVNPVFHPTLLIVKERPVVWGDGVAVCGMNNSNEYF